MTTHETQVVDSGTDALTFQRYQLTTAGGVSTVFDKRLIYVGTAPDSDFVIDDPTASRAHARLEFDGQGYILRDLASKNGTWIGGVRIREAYLPTPCTVRFGRTEVAFDVLGEQVEVELSRANSFGSLLGESTEMREIFALLAKVARSDVSVLVQGESGTGKELVAEAIQSHSARRAAPFVIFDCSAVPPDLAESELFGHVKGAFTGAVGNRVGVFEAAHKGTLFLDEIGELPLELQPKLLRALEKGEFKPVGDNQRKVADVRVIAATNRNLTQEVRDGNFREDLYYRLAVIKVSLPPLRKRPDDIPLLVQRFLRMSGSTDVQVSWETMDRLKAHPWQGNVRELKNYVERAVVLAEHGRLETRHLSASPDSGAIRASLNGSEATLTVDFDLPFKDAKARLTDTFESRYWGRLLQRTGGNISEAARRGGIHRKSLEYLLKKLDL